MFQNALAAFVLSSRLVPLVCLLLLHPLTALADATATHLTATITSQADTALPVGSILAWYSKRAPGSGWLECNGLSFEKKSYPKLFAYLGNQNTTPDLRNLFLRGGESAQLGNVVADSIATHAVAIPAQTIGSPISSSSATVPILKQAESFAVTQGGSAQIPIALGETTSSLSASHVDGKVSGVIGAHEGFYVGASETAPKHVFVRYFIRAL